MTELEKYLRNGGKINQLPIGNKKYPRLDEDKITPESFGFNEKGKKLYKFYVNGIRTDETPSNVVFITLPVLKFLIRKKESQALCLSKSRGLTPEITKGFIEFLMKEKLIRNHRLHEYFDYFLTKYKQKAS